MTTQTEIKQLNVNESLLKAYKLADSFIDKAEFIQRRIEQHQSGAIRVKTVQPK